MVGSYLLLARTASACGFAPRWKIPRLRAHPAFRPTRSMARRSRSARRLAGLAGALMVPVFSLFADLGLRFLIQGFVAVMVGGVGSFAGPVAGAGVIGTLSRRAAVGHSAGHRRCPRVCPRHRLHQVPAARPGFRERGIVSMFQRSSINLKPPPLSLSGFAFASGALATGVGSWVVRPDWANAAADPIKVGIATDLTGPIGYAGNADANVAKMVIKEINDAAACLGGRSNCLSRIPPRTNRSRSATFAS